MGRTIGAAELLRIVNSILHWLYAEWTRKIGGKTVTRRLTPGQLAAWQPLFDNARKMRELLSQIQELTLAIIDDSPPEQ